MCMVYAKSTTPIVYEFEVERTYVIHKKGQKNIKADWYNSWLYRQYCNDDTWLLGYFSWMSSIPTGETKTKARKGEN